MVSPKLSFACKIIDIEDIIRCSFDLNKTEYLVLIFLLRHKSEYSTSDIASKLNKDRTTVQKAIKSLIEKDLIFRRQINLSSGGYVYYYSIKDKEKLKKRVLTLIDNWADSAKRTIINWGSHF